MPRYLAQRNDYTCAPIAIINAEKWTGIHSTVKRLPELISACRTSKTGTYIDDWEKVARSNPHFRMRKWREPNLRATRKHLLAGGGLFMDYVCFDEKHHIVFIAGITYWYRTTVWEMKNNCNAAHDFFHTQFVKRWRRRVSVWRVWKTMVYQ